MSYPYHCRIIEQNHRLLERCYRIIVSTASMVIAVRYTDAQGRPFTLADSIVCQCVQIDADVTFPITNAIEHALHDVKPAKIHFIVGPRWQPPRLYNVWASGLVERKPDRHVTGLAHMMTGTLAPNFVEYFETYKQWLFDRLGKPDLWPPVWRFARVIRNSISHGGNIKIEKPTEPPVTWYGAIYDYGSNGRLAFGPYGDLEFADMIILMFEMSDTLDELGCPF